VAPTTQVEQTEYLTTPEELVGWHERPFPYYADLTARPGRALEVWE
jgi:hypothetical protein